MGEGPFSPNLKSRTIKIVDGCLLLERNDGEHKAYAFEDGLGAIFLSPLPDCRLEIVVWGLDELGLRLAARLFPMLTGVGQPDFIIVRRRCAWEGAAGVLAMGPLTNSWKASEVSFIS